MAEAHGDEAQEVSGDLVAETISYLARSIVGSPDDVRVERGENERGPVWRLHVHPDDVGRVIGKGGRVARAIRQVARAAGARAGTSAWVEIAD